MNLKMHFSGYDINCQFSINQEKRMMQMRDLVQGSKAIKTLTWPSLVVKAVGKLHLPAHKPECRYKFSYNYLLGAGRDDGEAQERVWWTLYGLAATTREMTSGRWHDRINEHHSDMNWKRTVKLGT